MSKKKKKKKREVPDIISGRFLSAFLTIVYIFVTMLLTMLLSPQSIQEYFNLYQSIP